MGERVKLDFGQAVSLLANAGVIVGIVFLAMELQQSTEVQLTQMRFNANERRTEAIEEFYRNPQLSSAYLKFANQQQLTPEENLILSTYAQRIFVSWDWTYGEIQRGSMEESAIANFSQIFHAYGVGGLNAPLLSNYWPAYEQLMSPAFRDWMERNVVNR